MSRRLLLLGAILTLATATIWLGGAVDWMPASVGDLWSGWTLKGALLAFGAALALRLLSPVAGVITTGRCSVCGRPTQRGTYCLDHLQETVNRNRDLSREELPPRERPRVQAQPRS
jgi:hypothetical protein